MKKIAVIGSNCFTGSHIVDALLESTEARVIGISRSAEPQILFLPYTRHDDANFSFYRIDIVRSFEKLRDLIKHEKPDVVINVAALSDVGVSNFQPAEYYAINTQAVVQLVDFLRGCDWLERYVHISSAEIYGSCDRAITEDRLFNPSTPYAVSKAAGDMHIAAVAKQFGFPALTIRSTNVYGPHQQLFKIIPRTAIYIKLGKTIELHGGGRSIKSFVHIRDVVSGLLSALRVGKNGVYHFSIPDERTIADIVKMVCDRMNSKFESSTKIVDERLGQDQRYWLDCSKAAKDLEWKPKVEIGKGIDETVRWIEKNWATIKNYPLEYEHKV